MSRTRRHIIIFARRAIVLLVGWMIIEQWVLDPYRIIEYWIAPSLASVTSGLLALWYDEVWIHGAVLGINAVPGIHIVKGCVGLSYYAMFAGFVLAFPARKSIKHQLSFVVFGMGLIYLINLIRLLSLAVIQLQASHLLDQIHYWTGSYLFFSVIMGLWFLYIQELPIDTEK